VNTPFFISPAYCVPRMTISLCFRLISMLVELVMKLLYCRIQEHTRQYRAVQSDLKAVQIQVRLMAMLVELVMKLLYCKHRAVQKQ
jgi:hypothetical protein